MIQTNTYNQEIVKAVEEGFSKTPKRLPSWLFYDEIGDKIFQAIMRMPEYYLTRSEFEIFRSQKEKILSLVADGKPFKLVELGAGDGTKTEILLRHFVNEAVQFTYIPVDVSEAVLNQLATRLTKAIPDLKILPENKLYKQALKDLNADDERKVILFLGANIGNFRKEEALDFIRQLAMNMRGDDLLLVGFDLKKDPRLVQAAYDDSDGITREFNLNLLGRLNRELGAQFDLDKFTHYPFYDPETGVTKSYLISQERQDVYFEAFDKTIVFDKWEIIHTEVSQKYDMSMIRALAVQSGLRIVDVLYDKNCYFCDVVLRLGTTTGN